MSSRLRKIARDAMKSATSGEPDPSSEHAQTLIDRLHESGLLEGHTYNEIVSAFLNVGARAIHEQSGLPAEAGLRVFARTASDMAELEVTHGWLQASWEKPN